MEKTKVAVLQLGDSSNIWKIPPNFKKEGDIFINIYKEEKIFKFK